MKEEIIRLVRCQRCGIEKPLSDYYALHRKYCGKCECDIQKEKRKKEREKWQQPQKCLVCGREFLPYRPNSKYCSEKCNQERYKVWQKENPIKYKAWTLAGCLRGIKNKTQTIENLLKSFLNQPCRYCGVILTLENVSIDHKNPIGSRKTKSSKEQRILDNPSNLQIICKKCNSLKSDMNDNQFMRLLAFLNQNLDLKELILKRLRSSFAIFRNKLRY